MMAGGDNAYGQLGLGDTLNRGDEPNEMGEFLPAVDLGVSLYEKHVGRHDWFL